jgi:hypothetical protein
MAERPTLIRSPFCPLYLFCLLTDLRPDTQNKKPAAIDIRITKKTIFISQLAVSTPQPSLSPDPIPDH